MIVFERAQVIIIARMLSYCGVVVATKHWALSSALPSAIPVRYQWDTQCDTQCDTPTKVGFKIAQCNENTRIPRFLY